MKTDSIRDTLKMLFGDKESYSQEEIDTINSLSINRFDIVGDIQEINYNDLLNFSNLEHLTIQQCILDDDAISILCKLKKLKSLTLLFCEFEGDYQRLFQLELLKDLCFEGTKINLGVLNGKMFDSLTIAQTEILEKVSFFANHLDISRANVKNWGFLENRINTLVVSYRQYRNNAFLSEYKGHIIVMEDDTDKVREEVNV